MATKPFSGERIISCANADHSNVDHLEDRATRCPPPPPSNRVRCGRLRPPRSRPHPLTVLINADNRVTPIRTFAAYTFSMLLYVCAIAAHPPVANPADRYRWRFDPWP